MKSIISNIKKSKFQKCLLLSELCLFLLLLCFAVKPKFETFIPGNQLTVPENGVMEQYVARTLDGLLAVAIPEMDDEMKKEPFGEIPLILGGGRAYHVIIDYENMTAENPTVGQEQCYLQIESKDKIVSNTQELYDNAKRSEGIFWVSPFRSSVEAKAVFYCKAPGMTVIKGVRIEESLRYRIFFILTYLFLCAMGWLLIWYVIPLEAERKIVLLSLFGIVLYASLPLFTKNCYYTQDIRFHLKRIGSLAAGLSRGDFHAWYEPDVANGFGYVEHIFYPKIFLYFPAFLHMLDVPLYMCYKIYILTMNIATCAVSYWSFRRIFSSRVIGLLGSGIYSLAIYRIYNIYGLNAMGEVSAKIFLPLLSYGLWKLACCDQQKVRLTDGMPLIIGGAGIICSHVLTCEILAVFLPIFFCLNWREYFQKNKIFLLCKSGVLMCICSLFFLIPMIDGLNMNMVVNQYDGEKTIGKYALTVSDLFRTVFIGQDSARAVGNAFLFGCGLFGICMIYRKVWGLQETKGYMLIRSVALLGGAAVWMCTDLFPWDYLPYVNKKAAWLLSVVQFPWRYLTIAGISLTLVTCYSVKIISEKLVKKEFGRMLMTAISLGMIGISILEAFNYIGGYVEENGTINDAYMNNDINNVLAFGDYLPAGTDYHAYETNEMMVSSSVTEVEEYHTEGDIRYCTVSNQGMESYIDLPVFHYKWMRAADHTTGERFQVSDGINGRMRVVIPRGYIGTLKIYFQPPALWYAAEMISWCGCLGCLAVICIQRKRDLLEM